MIQKNFNYPNFKNGQLMTSDLLNGSIGYVEEQERLTRVNLIGVGILDGLTYEYAKGCLTINPGTAVTSDGFIIHFSEKRTYSFATTEKGAHISSVYPLSGDSSNSFNFILGEIEYVWYKDQSEAESFGVGVSTKKPNESSLDSYNVALMVYFPEKTSVNCNQYTCDRNYIQTNVAVRPILVKKKNEGGFPVLYKRLSEIKATAPTLKRLSDFESALNINVLHKRTVDLLLENSSVVANYLKEIILPFASDFSSPGKVVYNDGWKTVWPDYKDKIKSLVECLRKLQKIHAGGDGGTMMEGELPQYFLLFLEDMRNAIAEFVAFYNTVFVRKYPFLRTTQTMIDRVVVISPANSVDSDDVYQYRFSPVGRDSFYENICKVLGLLLSRIYMLSDSFVYYGRIAGDIHFSLKDSSSTMGENEIPYYYDETKIQPYWNPFSIYMDDWFFQKICDSQKNSDFFMFQNCYGKNVDEVRRKLVSFLAENGMKSVTIENRLVEKRSLDNDYYKILLGVFSDGRTRREIEKNLQKLYEARKENPSFSSGRFPIYNENNIREEIGINELPFAVRHEFQEAQGSIIRKKGSVLYVEKNNEGKKSQEAIALAKAQRELISASREDRISGFERSFLAYAGVILKVAYVLSFKCEMIELEFRSDDTPSFVRRDIRDILSMGTAISSSSSSSALDYTLEERAEIIRGAIVSAHDAGPVTIEQYALLRNILSLVSPEDFKVFYEFICSTLGDRDGLSSEKANVLFRNEFYTSFLALKSYVELGFDLNYINALYCGGASRDSSSIILFYSNLSEVVDKRFILGVYVK